MLSFSTAKSEEILLIWFIVQKYTYLWGHSPGREIFLRHSLSCRHRGRRARVLCRCRFRSAWCSLARSQRWGGRRQGGWRRSRKLGKEMKTFAHAFCSKKSNGNEKHNASIQPETVVNKNNCDVLVPMMSGNVTWVLLLACYHGCLLERENLEKQQVLGQSPA